MKLSRSHQHQKTKFFQYRDNYNLQGQSGKYRDLNDACVELVAFNIHNKEIRRQKVSASDKQSSKKSNLAHICNGKKELAIVLERKNVEQLVVVCKDTKLKNDVISNSKKFPNPKPKDPHQLDLNDLHFQQQHMINHDGDRNRLFTENRSLLIGSREIINDEQHMFCELVDETVSNSSITCSPQKLNTLDTFWFSSGSELPILGNVHEDEIPTNAVVQNEEAFDWKESPKPVKTDIVRPLTNSTCSTIDVELTPPSSAVSGSITSDDSISRDFSFVEELSRVTVVEVKRPKCHNRMICQSLEVAIVPVEPSLHQLQDLYRRKGKSKAKRFYRRTHFRERHLRPRNSLRQFTPFVVDPGLRKRNKLHLNDRKQIVKNKARKLACSQTLLFESAKKEEQKAKLRQKKKASKLRNQFENALDSINSRLFRQNQFWKMLPS